MTTKGKIYLIKELTEKEIGDRALDFVGDYSLDDIHYLGDAFHEFADNSISVYYSDQFKYYEEHPTESENALLELYDGDSIAKKIKEDGLYSLCCFAGVCGEYEEILQDLYTNEENIKKLLLVRYLIKHDLYNISGDQLTDLLEEITSADDDLTNILDIIQEATTERE